MKDLNVNVAIRRIFMNATLRAAIHLGNDHDVNLRNVKNYTWKSTGEVVGEKEKLISGQTETTPLNLIDTKDLLSSSIRHCQGLLLFRLGAVLGEKWEMIPINLGRTRFSGIQRTISSAN